MATKAGATSAAAMRDPSERVLSAMEANLMGGSSPSAARLPDVEEQLSSLSWLLTIPPPRPMRPPFHPLPPRR